MITGGGGGSSTPAFAFGTAAARPAAAAGNAKTGYFATDTGELTVSDGTTWQVLASVSGNFTAKGGQGFIFPANGAGASDGGNHGFLANNFGAGFGGGIYIGGSASTPPGALGGSLDIGTVGGGLKVAEGSNAKQGTATLVAGTVTVSNTSVTASSRIFLSCVSPGGTPGFLRVSAITAGTSFVITSSSGTDTSVVAYEIFEAG